MTSAGCVNNDAHTPAPTPQTKLVAPPNGLYADLEQYDLKADQQGRHSRQVFNR